MSNKPPRRRLSPMQQHALEVFGPLDGERIPGGCDECDAYQTVEGVRPGVWVLHVYHDNDCPELARHVAEG